MTSKSSDSNQTAGNNDLQIKHSDPRSNAATLTQSVLRSDTVDATSNAIMNAVSATKASSAEEKLTSLPDDIGGLPASPDLPSALTATEPANNPTSANASASQPDIAAQLISASVSATATELAASVTNANAAISPRVSKPGPTTAATMIKEREFNSVDAGGEEINSAGVSSHQVASSHIVSNPVAGLKQAASNQVAVNPNSSKVPVNQSSSNQSSSQAVSSGQQNITSKPTTSSPNSLDTNLQTLLANAAPAVPSGSVSGGSQARPCANYKCIAANLADGQSAVRKRNYCIACGEFTVPRSQLFD